MFGIVSNGILILRKTFENNYSNGCLPVASRNPTVEALKQTLGGVTPPPTSELAWGGGELAALAFEMLNCLDCSLVCHSQAAFERKGEKEKKGFSEHEAGRTDSP